MSEFWSLALSDERGRIWFYRSSLPGDSFADAPPSIPMWENVFETSQLALAWANCWATGEPQTLDLTARRNGRGFTVQLWRLPPHNDTYIVSHGVWSDDSKDQLTETQKTVCELLTSGQTPEEVASELDISRSTVQRQRSEAMQILGVKTHEQLGARFG